MFHGSFICIVRLPLRDHIQGFHCLSIFDEKTIKNLFFDWGKGPRTEKAFWLGDANSPKQAKGGGSSGEETQGRKVRWCRFSQSRKAHLEESSSESLLPVSHESFGHLPPEGIVIATSEGRSDG
jgi:hypothetical protein